MEPAPQTPRAPPSLSESWASISDAEYSHDEDLQSENTDAGSLIDVQSANDVQSVREEEEEEEEDDDDDVEEPLTQLPTPSDLRASTQSRTPAASRYISDSPQTDEITLDEPISPQPDEHVLVKHTLTPFTDSEAARLQLPSSSRDGYVGTLHMTLSKSPLQQDTRNSFRLLLLGPDYTQSLRTSLVNKVADALVASNDGTEPHIPPSRYHIVPDSFGPGSQPATAEVIPVNRTLDVESFHSAILGGENNKNVILCNEHAIRRTLSTFDERQGKYTVATPGWQQPDLALVLIDSKDAPDVRLSACTMMIFAKRLKIPMIVVRMDNDWNADFAPLIFADTGAQLCIEKRPLSLDSVLRSMPLDLNTFLNINAAQLGRHVAYLVQNSDIPSKSEAKIAADRKSSESNDIVSTAKGLLDELVAHVQTDGPRRMLQMIAVLAGTLILLQWFVVLKNGLNARYPGQVPSIIESLNNTPGAQSHTVPVTFSSSTASVPIAVGSHIATAKKLEAETLGNSHIIVRTPDKTSASQKFSIGVFRKDKRLETESNMLFPGVFSVRLDPIQAFGAMNVCVSTSKPASRGCVETNFGEQSFAAWVKELIDDGEDRLQQQLAGLHASLEDIRKSERPRGAMKEAHKRLRQLEHAAEQDLKTRWAAMLAWHSGAVNKMSGLVDKIQKDMGTRYEKARAGANVAYRGSMKSASNLLDSIHIRRRMGRLVQDGRGQIQSERLATSQERAQHMIKKLRHRVRQGRR